MGITQGLYRVQGFPELGVPLRGSTIVRIDIFRGPID